jgi:hypothetical protein
MRAWIPIILIIILILILAPMRENFVYRSWDSVNTGIPVPDWISPSTPRK